MHGHTQLFIVTCSCREHLFVLRTGDNSSVSQLVSQVSSVSLLYVRLPCALLLRVGDNSSVSQFSQSVSSVYLSRTAAVWACFYERVTTLESVMWHNVQRWSCVVMS
jgi:hypothetical protein